MNERSQVEKRWQGGDMEKLLLSVLGVNKGEKASSVTSSEGEG